MSIEKRVRKLEDRFGGAEAVRINVVQGDDDEPLRSFLLTPRGQRFADSVEQDFERSLRYAATLVDRDQVSRADLEGTPPRTIAAVYATLARRDDPRAQEFKEFYEEQSQARREHPASVELRERAPRLYDDFDRFFWEIVERNA